MLFIDWLIILAVLLVSLTIGFVKYKRSESSSSDFFLGKRGFVWWILGVSMVATTFSTDTPNLVANLVRKDGISGNWVWWAFLLTGMLTVFVFAKLWRRAEVLTDIEFYELRYSGKSASFLRIFRALYLGLIFNTFVMAAVNLAAIKIFGVILGIDAWVIVLVGSAITLSYSTLGGLGAIILTDFFQFFLAMVGSILACIYLVNMDSIGGFSAMLSHPNVVGKLSFIPTQEAFVAAFIVPLFISWWAAYYPGAEPGGGGYIAQRMFSAKDEKNAVKATLFFNFAHYGLRPWPWMIIALASLIVFPNLQSLQEALPQVDSSKIADDIAYPAMLQFLPTGLLGLVVASLVAAYMSTISTHINLGASYLTNDVYKRFLRPNASGKKQVFVGRISSVIITILAAVLALTLTSAHQVFNLLLMLGAGSGAIFILRWFWWRINAVSEISAMIISLFMSIIMAYYVEMPPHLELIIGVSITTIGWILFTFFSKPSEMKTLYAFCRKIQAGGPGWKSVYENARKEKVSLGKSEGKWDVPRGILCAILGCLGIYGLLFSTGYFIMGEMFLAIFWTSISVVSFLFIFRLMKKLSLQ